MRRHLRVPLLFSANIRFRSNSMYVIRTASLGSHNGSHVGDIGRDKQTQPLI